MSYSRPDSYYKLTVHSRTVTCSNTCPHFKAFRVCAHSLAMAIKLNMLESFVNFRQERLNKGTASANLTNLCSADFPNNLGTKKTKSTQIRKGAKHGSKKRIN